MTDLVILCAVLALAAIVLTLGGLLLFVLGILLLPVALVMIVVVWIIEWHGVALVRRRFGKLEMPIVTLREKNTGRLVRLVGVVHIAEAAYWKKLCALIDRYPRSAVLFESISKVSEEEKLLLTERERTVAKQLSEISSAMTEMGELMGLTFQKNGLPYPPHWIRTDMSGLDFIRAISAATEEKDTFFIAPKWTNEDKPIIHWVLRKAIGHMPLFSLFSRKWKKQTKVQTVIIELRNVIACEAIVKYQEQGDVISVWGGGHIPGMLHLLLQAGYEVIDTDWYDVIDGTSYSLADVIRDMKKHQDQEKKSSVPEKTAPE